MNSASPYCSTFGRACGCSASSIARSCRPNSRCTRSRSSRLGSSRPIQTTWPSLPRPAGGLLDRRCRRPGGRRDRRRRRRRPARAAPRLSRGRGNAPCRSCRCRRTPRDHTAFAGARESRGGRLPEKAAATRSEPEPAADHARSARRPSPARPRPIGAEPAVMRRRQVARPTARRPIVGRQPRASTPRSRASADRQPEVACRLARTPRRRDTLDQVHGISDDRLAPLAPRVRAPSHAVVSASRRPAQAVRISGSSPVQATVSQLASIQGRSAAPTRRR